MKNPTEQNSTTKSKFRGFYAALGISLVMIGAACFFAYQQTSSTLEQNLNSITEQMEMETTTTSDFAEAPVVGVQTDVIKETMPTTVAPTEAVPETTPQAETEAVQTEAPTAEMPAHQIVPPLSECNVINPFSNGELIKSETTGTWQTHNGVDLGCETGIEVFAIDGGAVTEVCKDALWGYTVTIDHNNGVISRYCGLDGAMEVRQGDTVQSGQKIGVVGDAPDIESALGTHLHIEVRKSGAYVDPSAYFGG